MNIINKIACLSLVSIMTACAPAGYYDSNGDYRSYGKSDSFRHDNAMGAAPPSADASSPNTPKPGTTTFIYTRPGYYDRNGYYIESNNGPHVSSEFFPPHGMCRVWFTDRLAEDEPRAESCQSISRIPAGAYVIYGG